MRAPLLEESLASCSGWRSASRWGSRNRALNRTCHARRQHRSSFITPRRFPIAVNAGRVRPTCGVIKHCSVTNSTLLGCLSTSSRHRASSPATSPEPIVPAYTTPVRGLAAALPKRWIPYAELMRLDKPTGTYYLFFPCIFSTLIAAPMTSPISTPWDVISMSGLFLVGSLVMRGAGCTINDLLDRHLDPLVERTKFRPLARRAITPQGAIIFTSAQLITGLGVLLQFPVECLWYGIPSLLLVAAYPLAKRVTNYPQFVLGLTFSWGAIMGFPALGVELLNIPNAAMAASALYGSCVAWTVLYDTIYGHMDAKDDVTAGIKSIALKHQDKSILCGLAVTQVGLLAVAGMAAGAGPVFFVGSCGSASLTLGAMIWRVRLKEPKNCWWWFKNGCWFTGGGMAFGMLGEYLAQLLGMY